MRSRGDGLCMLTVGTAGSRGSVLGACPPSVPARGLCRSAPCAVSGDSRCKNKSPPLETLSPNGR